MHGVRPRNRRFLGPALATAAIAGLVALWAGAPAVSAGPEPAAAEAPAANPKAPVVVALGDSVPAGSACDCPNFVSAYAAKAADAAGTSATVRNYAVSGSTSADARALLGTGRVRAAVAGASTVLIMTGANDFVGAFEEVSGGAIAATAYPPVAHAVQTNITAAVRTVRALNDHARVVVLDYWAAMEDGDVAAHDYDAATRRAAAAATGYLDDAISAAARATGATYVSTFVAFKGADGSKDPTPLLADDGDHPNAAGHRVIARAVAAALSR